MATLIALAVAVALSFSLVPIVMPQLGEYFETVQVGWSVTVLSLVGAVASPILGKLGDILGKKRVLVAAAGAGAVGGVITAMASSYGLFLFGRGLQGLLFPTIPLGYSLMRDIFSKRWFAMGASLATTSSGLSAVVAALISGSLVDQFGLKGVFWFLGLMDVALFACTIWLVPKSTVRLAARIDYLGAALLALTVGAALLCLSSGAVWGWTSPQTFACLAAAAICAALFVVAERRARDPLVPWQLVRRRGMAATIAAGFLVTATITGVSIVIPQIAQATASREAGYGFGLSPLGVSYFTVPAGALSLATGFAVGIALRRIGPKPIMVAGAAVLAIAAAVMATQLESQSGMITAYCFAGIGTGLASAAIPNLIAQVTAPHEQGVAAGVAALGQSLGGDLGTQLVTFMLLVTAAQPGPASPPGAPPQPTASGHAMTLVCFAVFSGLAALAALAVGKAPRAAEPGA
jgi:MFS family permease